MKGVYTNPVSSNKSILPYKGWLAILYVNISPLMSDAVNGISKILSSRTVKDSLSVVGGSFRLGESGSSGFGMIIASVPSFVAHPSKLLLFSPSS